MNEYSDVKARKKPVGNSISSKNKTVVQNEEATATPNPSDPPEPVNPNKPPEKAHLKDGKFFWIGVTFLFSTVVFLMGIVVMSLMTDAKFGYDSRSLIVFIVSISLAASMSVLGGHAAADGKIKNPLAKEHSVVFGLTGGIVVFLGALFSGNHLYAKQAEAFLPQMSNKISDLDSLVEDYVTTYQITQMSLDRQVFVPNAEKLDTLKTPEDYLSFLTTYFVNNPEKENDLITLIAFYESVLSCEAENNPGCSTEEIEKNFGNDLAAFLNTYGSYLKVLTDGRYKGSFSHLLEKV